MPFPPHPVRPLAFTASLVERTRLRDTAADIAGAGPSHIRQRGLVWPAVNPLSPTSPLAAAAIASAAALMERRTRLRIPVGIGGWNLAILGKRRPCRQCTQTERPKRRYHKTFQNHERSPIHRGREPRISGNRQACDRLRSNTITRCFPYIYILALNAHLGSMNDRRTLKCAGL